MLPQSAQNLLPFGLANPQFGQFTRPSLASGGPSILPPHSPQNLLPSGFSEPQVGHLIGISSVPSGIPYDFLLGLPFRCLLIRSLILRFLLLGSLRYEIVAPPCPLLNALSSLWSFPGIPLIMQNRNRDEDLMRKPHVGSQQIGRLCQSTGIELWLKPPFFIFLTPR